MRHPDAPPEVQAWASAPPPWIEEVKVQHIDSSLPEILGMGERQAISLAMERSAAVLLIDEWAGRKEAEARQINVAGTLAILLQASLRGYLNFPNEMDRLRQLGFRVSPAVRATMRARYEEATKTP